MAEVGGGRHVRDAFRATGEDGFELVIACGVDEERLAFPEQLGDPGPRARGGRQGEVGHEPPACRTGRRRSHVVPHVGAGYLVGDLPEVVGRLEELADESAARGDVGAGGHQGGLGLSPDQLAHTGGVTLGLVGVQEVVGGPPREGCPELPREVRRILQGEVQGGAVAGVCGVAGDEDLPVAVALGEPGVLRPTSRLSNPAAVAGGASSVTRTPSTRSMLSSISPSVMGVHGPGRPLSGEVFHSAVAMMRAVRSRPGA